MTIYSDQVSINATTAGVSGTITVPMNAKLIGLNMAATGTTASAILGKVGITWPGLQTPMNFVPNLCVIDSTNGPGYGTCKSPLIDLRKLPAVKGTNTITITLTSTANVTVSVGLMWIA